MKVRDAKDIARRWAVSNLPAWPRVVGALLAGSINYKADDADWSSGSDVDLWIFQNGEPSPRPAKFRHDGIILEAATHRADPLADVNQVLAAPHLAPHVAAGEIVYDPQGDLATLRTRVAPDFAKPHWIEARMKWAVGNATSKFEKCAAPGGGLVGRLCLFVLGVRNAAAIAAISSLDNPTFRRCLVIQAQQLSRLGRLELHEQLLEVTGSAHQSRDDVQRLLPPLPALFDRACAVRQSPFWAEFELDPTARSLFIDGTQEMIDAGYPREAALFVLFIHYFCHQAIQSDGTDADKAASMALLEETLRQFGIHTVEDLHARARRGLDLLPVLAEAGRQIARAHST